MTTDTVENVGSRTPVRWSTSVVLFAALYCACAVIPAIGFWLVLGDSKLVWTAFATGFAMAALSCGAIIGTQLSRAR